MNTSSVVIRGEVVCSAAVELSGLFERKARSTCDLSNVGMTEETASSLAAIPGDTVPIGQSLFRFVGSLTNQLLSTIRTENEPVEHDLAA